MLRSRGSTPSCRYSVTSTMAATPNGRLIQKIHGHPTLWTTSPPTSGPTIDEIPQMLEIHPWMRPRSSSEYRSPASVTVIGCTAPAPRPWRKRNATSAPIERASPHSTDPARNTTMPAMNTGLRPRRSESLPKMGMVTACISRNDENTQL
jgi:hypothetical protein